MGLILTNTIDITKAHKRVIKMLVENNPGASLNEVAITLNGMPEMMTCHTSITSAILRDLGYDDPSLAEKPILAPAGGNGSGRVGADAADALAAVPLSVESIRKQLERRHRIINARIESILIDENTLLSTGQMKTVEVLEKIDEKIRTQLLELMGQESTPTLPEAILIMCMRRLGVPDEDILTIEQFIREVEVA